MKFSHFMIPLSIMALLLVDCKGDHTTNPGDDGNDGPPTIVVEAPDMIISVDEAVTLYKNYGENRIGLIEAYEEELGQVDNYRATTSLTFDFEMMKQYMKYVEQQAKSAGTDIKGLRVYLGQYDLKNSPHPNAETVFFNPTMKRDGSEVAFAIQDQNGTPVAVTVGEVLGNRKPAGKSNLILKLQDDDDITSLAGNRGGRRPPPSTDDDDYFHGNN